MAATDKPKETAASNTEHLLQLPGCTFGFWRWAELRGAGFPAQLVLRVGAPEVARAAEHLDAAISARTEARRTMFAALHRARGAVAPEDQAAFRAARKAIEAGRTPELPESLAALAIPYGALTRARERVSEKTAEYERAFHVARERVALELRKVAADRRFVEAVTWQNPAIVERGLSRLAATPTDASSATRQSTRHRENLVAMYLERYATKNDTIGFFGPEGWATLCDDDGIEVTPGPTFLEARGVHFEQWAIDAVAETIAGLPGVRRWLAPRRLQFVHTEGTTVSGLLGRHAVLGEAEAWIVMACDGVKGARTIAAELAAQRPDLFVDEERVLEMLASLHERTVIAWDLALPLAWDPETELRRRLVGIGDETLRARTLATLDALCARRDAIAAAAGDPDRLAATLADLASHFSEVTGREARRLAGSMYAARELVFEETRRAANVRVGRVVVDAIAPPLSLMLASCRWLTAEIARLHRAAFRATYDDLRRRSDRDAVPFSDFFLRSQRLLYGTNRPIDAAAGELRARWERILAVPPGARHVALSSANLEPLVTAAFGAQRRGWPHAKYHCPDVMIAAESVDAIRRGEALFVLGELHVATNSMDALSTLHEHPCSEELLEAVKHDMPGPRVLIVQSKEAPKITVRVSRAFVAPQDFLIVTGAEPARAPASMTIGMWDLLVEPDGDTLRIRSADGRLSVEVVELFGDVLGRLVAQEFAMLTPAPHQPRVTIDRLVVARETWRVAPSAMSFAATKAGPEQFAGARRWAAQLHLPRFVFVKAAGETKPIYVDLESPLFVRILAKVARAAASAVKGAAPLVITEMLPAVQEAWLPDAEGNRYTSELRLVAVDRLP